MEILYEGELIKAPPQGKDVFSSLKRWKRRHFKLRKELLEYYSDPTGVKCLGFIKLDRVKRLGRNLRLPKYPHSFSLETDARIFILAAENEEKMNEWIKAVDSAIKTILQEASGNDGDYMNLENVKEFQRERNSVVSPVSEASSQADYEQVDDYEQVIEDRENANPQENTKNVNLYQDPKGIRAKILHNYNGCTKNQLTIKIGNIVDVLDDGSRWWIVRDAEGEIGLAPSNYLELI